MRYKKIRITLSVLEGCTALGAFGGGIAILSGVFDQWLPRTFLQGTPFTSFLVPGLVLTFVIGGGMLLAAIMQYVRRYWAILLSAAMGLVLVVWEAVEIAIIDRFPQVVIPSTIVQQALFSLVGLTILGLASYEWIKEYQRHHTPISHVVHVWKASPHR